MPIPSGNGTEVLKSVSLKGNSNAWTTILNGVGDHIYTILSVVFVNTTNAAINIALQVDPTGNASNEIYLKHYSTDSLPAYSSYVWNDKFVMSGLDHLIVYSSTTCDMYVSYIDQDWT
tara:strand:- start:29 stop:382 length:354 start_codon:yes stop_codon:yes gene_type:complete